MEKMKFHRPVAFLICIFIYLAAVLTYVVWSNHEHRKTTIHEIDQKLVLAAKSLKFMLAPDFHDRAIAADSISMAEELKNRAAISGLAFDTDMEWLYTLVEKNGHFYFSAPTVTTREANEKERWYFLPYDDIPQLFVEAYKQNKILFSEYKDQWGAFRSVAIPEKSPGGRTYLACADFEISDLRAILRKNQILSILTALYFFVCSLPLILFIINNYRSYTSHLKSINTELSQYKHHLEELVEQRTTQLKSTNEQLEVEIAEKTAAEKQREILIDKLQRALTEVKSLSGLLPICSNCKKIRDDKGYWNKIETYLKDHSEADFSHGLCPDCVEKLYGSEEWYKKGLV